MNITLSSLGYFSGQFLLHDDTSCRALGDYIEVTPRGEAYQNGDTVKTYRGEKPGFTIPLRVEFSCLLMEFDADLKIIPGFTGKHWYECLEVGRTSVVVAHRREHRDRVWYTPKIDGWVIGMFGKVKA